MGKEACILLIVFSFISIQCLPPLEDPNLYEGDIILDPEQKQAIKDGAFNKAVPLAAAKTTLWPRIIPYDYHEFKWHSGRSAIDEAIEMFEKNTCLRFIRRTNEKGYLKFYKNYKSCSTQVGYNENEVRRIFLGDGCWETHIATHEMMHALGFYHEQNRPDRDKYVDIRYQNIFKSALHQFKKRTSQDVDNLGIPYDYLSIMHYRGKAFSKNGLETLVTSDPFYQDKIGNQKNLSRYDIEQINLLYKCNEPVTTISPPGPTTRTFTQCSDIYDRCLHHVPKCSLPRDNIWFKWMAKECRKTCKFCDEKNDEVFNDLSCLDIYRYCDRHTDKCSLPDDDVWRKWVNKDCRKTCGFCKGGTVTTTAPSSITTAKPTHTDPGPICKDKLVNCATYSHLCQENDYWKRFGKINCKKTCGYCTGDGPVTTVSPACMDLARCTSYVIRGYCKAAAPAHFHKYMKINCIKSCGWCDKFTPLPPVGPTPPWPKECGVSTHQGGRVIGGQEAVPGAWPWIARLYRNNTDSSYCGATLISSTWLVTAAHCVIGKTPKDVAVRVGLHDRFWTKDRSVQEIGAQQIIVHYGYDKPSRMNNDIALIQLSKPVMLNDRVKVACLPKHDETIAVGTKCYLAGWGKTNHPGSGSRYLQQTHLKIVANDICHALNYANYRIPVTGGMVCAGNEHGTKNGACHGDSGGPLVCKQNGRFYLHGDVSWGSHNCDRSRGYSVFGRISLYRQWMDLYIYS